MTHEVLIGVGTERGEFVIPTVVKGENIGEAEARRRFMAGELKPIAGPFGSIAGAERFAERRSRLTKPPRFPKKSLAGQVERKGFAGVLREDPLVKGVQKLLRRRGGRARQRKGGR